MFVAIGYILCLGCIFGAYAIHGGNMQVIIHAMPTEMMAIGGGAIGAFLVNNQPKTVKAVLKAFGPLFKGSKYSKDRYLEMMAMMFEVLQKIRKEGLMSIEKDVEDPHNSALFSKYPTVGHDHHVIEFVTDYLRMMVSGHSAVAAVARLAGALPAFGIVAAVLGVVNTMGSVGQPPAVLGGMIGSALVGTFLGILLAYGVVEPLGGLMEQKLDEGTKEFQVVKTVLLASMQGYAPQVAIEFGRKVLYSTERPTFAELEAHVKKK
jgi:chemotaxis protein MotA